MRQADCLKITMSIRDKIVIFVILINFVDFGQLHKRLNKKRRLKRRHINNFNNFMLMDN